jgi:hypothetical protein
MAGAFGGGGSRPPRQPEFRFLHSLGHARSINSRRLAWYCALARFSKSPRFNLQNGQRSTLARNLRLHFGFGHSLNGSGFGRLPLSAILLLVAGLCLCCSDECVKLLSQSAIDFHCFVPVACLRAHDWAGAGYKYHYGNFRLGVPHNSPLFEPQNGENCAELFSI